MLQWLRRVKSKKSFRIVAILGITILSVGLVGSFAIWSVPNLSLSRADEKAAVDPSVQYEQMEKRIAELEKSLSDKKDNPELLEKLGNAYYDLGFQMFMDGADADTALAKLNAALDNYGAALEADPENVSIMLQAASTATSIGSVDRAESLYKQALEVDPDSPETKMYYGHFLLYGKNDFKSAREQWQEALQLNPDSETKQNLEALIEQANQLEEAQKEAEDKQEEDNN